MGAITSNRKRGDEYFSANRSHPFPNSFNSPEFHFSKKPRLSFSHQTLNPPALSSRKIVSRIALYPEKTPSFRREVHGPCRQLKFGSALNLGREYLKVSKKSRDEEFGDVMGNVLSYKYNEAKKHALGTIKHLDLKKGKEVSVDNEPVKEEAISDDSSIEEVEIIEYGRERQSVESVSDERPRGDNGIVQNVQEMDVKMMDSSVVLELSNGNLRVESAEKLLDSLSLDRDVDISGASAYKKLLGSAVRRSSRLRDLNFQIELNEKRRNSLQLLRPVKELEEEVPHEPFVPLTKEEEAEVRHALYANRRTILVKHEKSNIEITGEVLQRLRPGAWLNDEVINLYLELLKEREKREPQKFLKCHFFNTFFYERLIRGRSGYDYQSVKRWTSLRKLGYGLIECDKIFVPIHQKAHWCLAVINKKYEKFQYLDSLRGRDRQVLEVLARYFVDEVKEKSGKDINVSSWKQEYVEDLPEQGNTFDCGMFMIKYADFYSRGLGLCFNQDHMPYFRLRTAKEILRLRAE